MPALSLSNAQVQKVDFPLYVPIHEGLKLKSNVLVEDHLNKLLPSSKYRNEQQVKCSRDALSPSLEALYPHVEDSAERCSLSLPTNSSMVKSAMRRFPHPKYSYGRFPSRSLGMKAKQPSTRSVGCQPSKSMSLPPYAIGNNSS